MSNPNTLNFISSEITLSMVTQFTSDIAERLECEWALAMEVVDSGLVPVYKFGHNSDLERCLAETKAVLNGPIAATDLRAALIVLQKSHSANWMSKLLCLVRVHGEIVAVLALGPRRTVDEYTQGDQDLIRRHVTNFSFLLSDERLTTKIGTDIARSRRTRCELESAREVQQRFLPHNLPGIIGLDYYGESQPLGEVGGDFFDFISVGDSSLLLSVGDVSGKGVPSAIIMAAVQGSLRALESCMDFDICKIMHNLNRMIWQLAPHNFFATMFCARVDVAKREMHYVNAGHDRAVLLRGNEMRAITLNSTGGVLGLSTRTVFGQRKMRLEPRDTLVVVTDGITEGADLDGSAFDQAMLDGVRKHADESARALAEHIIHAAQPLNRDAEAPPDDKTVVVVRRTEEMAEALSRSRSNPGNLRTPSASEASEVEQTSGESSEHTTHSN